MMIYLGTFFTSTVFFYFYEKSKNKTIKNLLVFIAILIPCLLAGFRDVSIGVDTSGYVKTLFDTAKHSDSIIEYYNSTFYYEWHNTPVANFDLAYTLLTYICACVFQTFPLFLFLSEVFIILPIVSAVILYKKYFNISISLSMLMFFLIYYNTTYNAVRQWLSIAFAFLALAHFCTDKNIKKVICYALIAPLFHKSGLLVIILLVFYVLINKIKGINVRIGPFLIKREKVKVIEIFFCSLVLLISMSSVIVPILSGIGLSRYVGYISGRISFSINQLIYQLPFLIILFIQRKKIFLKSDGRKNAKQYYMMFAVCIFFINAVLSQIATIMENSWRVMLLFGVFNIITFSLIYNAETNKTKKTAFLIILLVYMICYWFFTFVITGRHGTVPYLPYFG